MLFQLTCQKEKYQLNLIVKNYQTYEFHQAKLDKSIILKIKHV